MTDPASQFTAREARIPALPATASRLPGERSIARFAHEILRRSGVQMAELASYVFKITAKY